MLMYIPVSEEMGCSVTYKQGPRPALFSYTFACGRYNGFSPSILLELISLPMVYAWILPCAFMYNVSSGSGTFHAESLRICTCWLCPETRCGNALKNNSGLSASYTL